MIWPRPFEPEIISPSRYLGKQWIILVAGGALVFLVFLRAMGVFSWLNRLPLRFGGFGYVNFLMLLIAGRYLWRGAIRPTYVRIAPGVIQVLRYRSRGGSPTVMDFPMAAGTMVIALGLVSPRPIPQPILIGLFRGGESVVIPLSQMGKDEALIERLWWAIMSTAPTPPLCAEELVG